MPKLHLIKDILDQRDISYKAFCAEIGMSESGLKRIIKQNSTRIQTVETITKALNIPIGYLFGEDTQTENNRGISGRKRDKLPHIPFHAQAGTLAGYSNGVTDDECDLLDVIPALGVYDFTIDVKGDSMQPEFYSGDVVACKLVRDLTELKTGKIYVLDTAQGVVMKKLEENPKDHTAFICVSLNPLYEPFVLSKEELFSVSRVVGVIKPAMD